MRVDKRRLCGSSFGRMNAIQDFILNSMRCTSWSAERCPPHSSFCPAFPTDTNGAFPHLESQRTPKCPDPQGQHLKLEHNVS